MLPNSLIVDCYRGQRPTLTILLFLLCTTQASLQAQKVEAPTFQTENTSSDTAKRWLFNGGLGLDLAAILLIHPRVGEGESKINAGGLFNFTLNYQHKNLLWNNRGSLQLSLSQEEHDDWSKSADAIQLNSQIGIRLKGKWYAAFMADVQTQLLSTYDNKYITQSDTVPRKLSSKFFAPATIKLAPGILYKPNDHFNLLLSAVSTKSLIIADNGLASQGDVGLGTGNLGNQWNSPTDYQTITTQVGAELRAQYQNKFEGDKVIVSSVLDLYSNYLDHPENVAIEWFSTLDIVLFKSFSVSIKSDWYYDHNVPVHISTLSTALGRSVSVRNGFYLKYNVIF
jgi:hypothetical protein